MMLSLGYGAALALFPYCVELWACVPLIMFIRMAMNAIDGMLANFTNQKTAFGAMLNEIGDQVSDAALILPFALAVGVNAVLLLVVAAMAMLVEFTGVAALLVGSPRRFEGPMGKSDRAFAFGLLAVLIATGVPPIWFNALLFLVLLLSLWTLIIRVRRALQHRAVQPTP